MKPIRMNVDDKLYLRIKASGYSWNELLMIGFRAKQLLDLISAGSLKDLEDVRPEEKPAVPAVPAQPEHEQVN